MKKTFAQLKRDLTVGKKIKFTEHNVYPEKVGEEYEISKKQSNAICTKQNGKDIYMSYPASSNLVDYEDNKVTFYEAGYRNITEEEKKHFEAMWQYGQDHIYENTYWYKKSYFEKVGMPYLMGCGVEKGKKFDHNKYKRGDMCCIQDNSIKGDVWLAFEIV